MPELHETIDLLEHSLRTRREILGNARTSVARETLKRLSESPAPARTAPTTPGAAPAAPAVQAGNSDPAELLRALEATVAACRQCAHLADFRTKTVFGAGNPRATLMFVGEAPGADEDRAGEPFVGRAGELLTKIISAMGLAREDVYIANVLKCRPDMPKNEPGNRPPTADEMSQCLPYLRQQIAIIGPRVLVALGKTAMAGLTGTEAAIGSLRGRWHSFEGIPLLPTYHPSYLLRNSSDTEKRKVWEDMMLVMDKLEMPISAKQRGFFLRKS